MTPRSTEGSTTTTMAAGGRHDGSVTIHSPLAGRRVDGGGLVGDWEVMGGARRAYSGTAALSAEALLLLL